MTCAEIQDRLMDLLSGTLPEADRAVLEVHLGSCAACREARAVLARREAQLRGHFRTLRAGREEALPVVSRRTLPFSWRPLAAAATILVALGFWVLRPGPGTLGPEAAFGDILVKKLGFTVTVFNHDLALVRDRRQILNLRPGINRFRFEDVPGRMDPTSMRFHSLTDPEGCKVLEQNFQYDLVSREKILARYVDREIGFERKDPKTEALVRDKATLLSASGIVRKPSGEVLDAFPGEPILPELPGGLLTRPALAWTLDAPKERVHETEVAYLTGGLSWRADYTMTLRDEKTLDLDAWVTVDNRSGASYEDARLKLIAGDPNRVGEELDRVRNALGEAGEPMAPPSPGGFQEKSFFEYHLYTLERPTTLRNEETKQIGLLSARAVPYRTEYVYEASRNRGVGAFLAFKNAKENQVGMPLPAGQVRLLAQDKDGESEQVAQAGIEHTAKDEDVRIPRGNAMDLVAERKIMSRQRLGKILREEIEIRLRNHGEQAVEILVLEHPGVRGGGDWQVTKQSHPHEKKDAATAAFRLQIPSGGETVLNYVWEGE